jgi:hypothetical protein
MVSFSDNWRVGRRQKTMPTEIVAETCPAPECNLTPRDVKQFVKELKTYHAQFKAAFRRPEQFKHAAIYLKGLLGDAPRKTIEPIGLGPERECSRFAALYFRSGSYDLIGT